MRAPDASMRAALRATFALGLSAAGIVLLGFGTAKVWAVWLGPPGVGDLGLAQGLVTLVTVVFDCGLSSAFVREASAFAQQGRRAELSSLLRTAQHLLLAAAAAALVVAALAHGPVGAALLGLQAAAVPVLLLVAAGLIAARINLEMAVVNSHQEVGALARAGFFGQLAASLVLVAVIGALGARGIALALVLAMVARWVVVRQLSRAALAGRVEWPGPSRLLAREPGDSGRLKSLFAVGAIAMMGALLASGIEALLPALVLHRMDLASVGCFRAAATFGAAYVGFALTVVAQSYLPRVSAAQHDRGQMAALIQEQHELIVMLALPALLVLQATAPQLVRWVYSPAFDAGAPLLQWQLVGDLLRFSSWAFTFALFARSVRAYLVVQALAAACLLGATWVGLHYAGLAGAGIASAVTYAVQWGFAAYLIARDVRARLSARNGVLLGAGLAVMLLVQAAGYLGQRSIGVGAAFAAALAFGAYAAARLRQAP